MRISQSAREFAGLWVLMLLAPVSWASALGILFSLTHEACISGSRAAMWFTGIGGLVLVLLPGLLAWRWRRAPANGPAARERRDFMLWIAIGGSALFTVVVLLSLFPVEVQDACRT